MKKISLKTVKNSMKRDEMRSVKGGSGDTNCGGGCPTITVYCYQRYGGRGCTGWSGKCCGY